MDSTLTSITGHTGYLIPAVRILGRGEFNTGSLLIKKNHLTIVAMDIGVRGRGEAMFELVRVVRVDPHSCGVN